MNTLLKFRNKIGLPDEVVAVVERAITAEYASLTKSGAPLTYPVTPYVHPDGMTLSISTGVTYPSKAERARNNPHVSLLYSDPVGTGLEKPSVVQVFGHGVVRDSDLQGNTDRYLQISMLKLPDPYKKIPLWLQRRMHFYYVRVWIEILPLRVLWWRDGDLQSEPQEWRIDPSIALPVSDPKPAPASQKHTDYTKPKKEDWRGDLQMAIAEIGRPVLTTVSGEYPVPVRVMDARLDGNRAALTLPYEMDFAPESPACLTFHEHDERFHYQRNRVFKGSVHREGHQCIFTISEQLGDWSLKGNQLAVMFDFFSKGRELNKRLAIEVQRRGQTVPQIRL